MTRKRATPSAPDADAQRRLISQLSEVQRELREALLQELLADEDQITQGLFDASNYSDQYEQYKYRYLDRLETLRRLLHEVNVLDKNRREFQCELLRAPHLAVLAKKLDRRLKALPATAAVVALEIERAPALPAPRPGAAPVGGVPAGGAPMPPAAGAPASAATPAAAAGVGESPAASDLAAEWCALLVTACWRAVGPGAEEG